jgi:hypothetical protein
MMTPATATTAETLDLVSAPALTPRAAAYLAIFVAETRLFARMMDAVAQGSVPLALRCGGTYALLGRQRSALVRALAYAEYETVAALTERAGADLPSWLARAEARLATARYPRGFALEVATW